MGGVNAPPAQEDARLPFGTDRRLRGWNGSLEEWNLRPEAILAQGIRWGRGARGVRGAGSVEAREARIADSLCCLEATVRSCRDLPGRTVDGEGGIPDLSTCQRETPSMPDDEGRTEDGISRSLCGKKRPAAGRLSIGRCSLTNWYQRARHSGAVRRRHAKHIGARRASPALPLERMHAR